MMDWTDRHCRFFLRLISRRALLYTEMVPTGAILRGQRARFLAFDPAEHPVALQVGGADPGELAECARIAAEYGYDEINLNVGCPSDRVRQARFGACLMAEPKLVAECVAAMIAAASIPVTVKTRIGIDEQDDFAHLARFLRHVVDAGCGSVALHARKAWLGGLSPKQNREIPPLDYARVYRAKAAFSDLEVVLNGGVASLDEAAAHRAAGVDGVMIGRVAYQQPYVLAEADRRFFADDAPLRSREEVVAALLPYAAAQCAQGVPLRAMTRHILGLFNGLPGARAWRRHLSEAPGRPDAGPEVIAEALDLVLSEQARRAAA